jgi:uncharacterized protein YprB with RNaseH-like and TPR domain
VSSPPESRARAGTLDELRRVIRRIEGARPFRTAPEPPETVLGGLIVETGAGPILTVRHEFPLDHRHGRVALEGALRVSAEAMRALSRDEELAEPRRLLFLDTETTGLAGGTGTYAFLVGAGFVEGERFVVVQYFMRDLDEEPALLAAVAPLLEGASGLVTFNGSGFDLPLLETRFVLGRRRWPEALLHVDLLRPARRVWAARFVDCRLGTLEREVLGHRREGDVPGSLIPSLYFDFLRRRHAVPLAPVFTHNRHDVLSLVALLGWLGWLGHALAHGEQGVDDGLDLAGLGRLWERVDPERAAACYRSSLAVGLPARDAHLIRLRLAAWEKRRARWPTACALWEEATAGATFDPRPWEELAKYHEHRARDVTVARAVVAAALGRAQAAGAPAPIMDALDHRRARLDRHLGRSERLSG